VTAPVASGLDEARRILRQAPHRRKTPQSHIRASFKGLITIKDIFNARRTHRQQDSDGSASRRRRGGGREIPDALGAPGKLARRGS